MSVVIPARRRDAGTDVPGTSRGLDKLDPQPDAGRDPGGDRNHPAAVPVAARRAQPPARPRAAGTHTPAPRLPPPPPQAPHGAPTSPPTIASRYSEGIRNHPPAVPVAAPRSQPQ